MGSYELLIEEDELKKIQLSMSDVIGQQPADAAKTISTTRNTLFNRTYSSTIEEAKKCRKSHETAKEILKNIKKGKNDKVREEIHTLN